MNNISLPQSKPLAFLTLIWHYQRWHKIVLLVLLFALGGFLSATWQPLCRCLPSRRIQVWVALTQRLWLRAVCVVLGVRLLIRGMPMQHNGLWVSNHVSWLDIVVLGALRPVSFLAKSEVATWPVVGFLGRQSGNLFIRRGHNSGDVLSVMTERLRGGDSVVLFPEGTTTRGDTVRRFHSRLLQPAISAGVPIQTVAIAYQGEQATTAIPFVDDDDFLPHLLRVLQLSRITVSLHFSEPLLVRDDLPRDSLAKTARAQVLSALNLVD